MEKPLFFLILLILTGAHAARTSRSDKAVSGLAEQGVKAHTN